jgi:hypothetical protein
MSGLPPRKTGSQLPWIDRDLHYGIWTQMVADFSMMFRVPMPNPSLDLTDTVLLKNRDGLCSPSNVCTAPGSLDTSLS